MPAKFLAKEAIAEVLPSDIAVKKPEAKMLNPDSRKLKPKSHEESLLEDMSTANPEEFITRVAVPIYTTADICDTNI